MKCPNCQHKLDLMGAIQLIPKHARVMPKPDEDVFELQFNCENCTYDYKFEVAVPHNTELYPIFWG